MKIEYYPIRGRGEGGLKFQLARIQDEKGNLFKGQYDQERHFGSEEEVKEHIAGVVGAAAGDIELQKMNL